MTKNPTTKKEISLQEDEANWIKSSSRCMTCNHLEVFHNEHCCEFCMVPDCKCEWGKLVEEVKKP